MKRSFRLPFTLLLVFSLFVFLSFRTSFHRCAGVPAEYGAGVPAEYAAGGILPYPNSPNETLFKLSAFDPSEDTVRKDVHSLLDGNLPGPAGRSGRYRPGFVIARSSSDRRFLSPKDLLSRPEFRRSLLSWYRLRRFEPEVISQLPDLTTGRRYESCAVVGNSGILLKSEHGDLIDSHEVVIRLNNARINGFGRHVGWKTNISFINSNILHLCARRRGCYCHPYGEGVPIVMYICQAVHFVDLQVCNVSGRAPIHVTDARFDLLCARMVKYYSLKRFVRETGMEAEEWAKKHDEMMFHYSSGMQAVMLAVGICDRVSVFGFGKSAEAKHHYHTNQKAELDLHDYEAEYEFYRDLTHRPHQIPFLHDSRFKVPPIVFHH